MKIKDRVALCTLIGILSALAGKSSAYLIKIFYPSMITETDTIGRVFFTVHQLYTVPAYIFSTFLSLTIGPIFTFGYILLLDLTGWRLLWLKGYLVASTGYVLTGLLIKGLHLLPQEELSAWIPIFLYLAHLVLGTVMIVLTKLWGLPKKTN